MEDDSTLLSSRRRTRIGLFANCYEKDENMESAKKRAFGLGPGLGSRIPRGIHGVWGRSAGTTRRFIILCFPAWWVLASGFRFCRDDGKKPRLVRWSGDSGASREGQAAQNQSLPVICFGGRTEDSPRELAARLSAATSFCSLSRGQISVCRGL